MTPTSGGTPYCDIATALQFKDWREWADLLSDNDVPLTEFQVGSSATFNKLLMAASGEIEEALLSGGKYEAEDLYSLTGNGKSRLEELVTKIAFRKAHERRNYVFDEKIYNEIEDVKKRLRAGHWIFAFAETQESSEMVPVTRSREAANRSIVRRAQPFFGRRGFLDDHE